MLELTKQINAVSEKWNKVLFIDRQDSERRIKDIEIYSFERVTQSFDTGEIEISIALGEPSDRRFWFEKFKENGFNFATLIHPSVHIPACTTVKEGAIIFTGSFISCDVAISENVVILPHANIGHDTYIGKHSVISGFANIAGRCSIGEESYIALSAAMKQGTKIGNKSIVGMGSMIVRDIPDNVVAMGNPARPMKNNEEHKVFK